MKKSVIKFLLASVMSSGLMAGVQAAPLALPSTPYAVYTYSGSCVDCAEKAKVETFDVRGTLTLQSFVPGGAVSPANFYSLTYSGSNLFPAFSIFGSEVINAGGFNAYGGEFPLANNNIPADFYVTFQMLLNPNDPLNLQDQELTQVFYRSQSNRFFELGYGDGSSGNNDMGVNLVYALAAFVPTRTNDIPEPGSLLLAGAAMAAAALARSRRKAV